MLNIKSILVGDPNRLRYVQRYSTCRVVHPDNVAEHMYYVTLYAVMLARDVEHHGGRMKFDYRKLMLKCVLHDLDEAVTGDVPRMFKHSSEATRLALHAGASQMVQTLFCSLFDRATARIPGNGDTWFDNVILQENWETAKDNSYEGCILELADFLSVLSFLLEEKQTYNTSLQPHIDSMVVYFKRFEHVDYEFLRPYLQQVETLMTEHFNYVASK